MGKKKKNLNREGVNRVVVLSFFNSFTRLNEKKVKRQHKYIILQDRYYK